MVTEFQITRIKTVSGTNHLYIEVEFYVDSALTHTEDFIIGRPAEKRIYTGPVGPNGEILDPEAYKVELLDIEQDIVDALLNFESSHRGGELLTGPETRRTNLEIEIDTSDPLGFIGRAEVQALINTKIVI